MAACSATCCASPVSWCVLGHTVDIYTMKWQGDTPGAGISTHLLPGRGLLNHKRYEDFFSQAQAEIAKTKFDLIVGFNRLPGLDVYFAADPCFEERARKERGFFYRLLGRYKSFAACERAVFEAQGKCEIMTLTPDVKAVFQHWYGTPDSRFHLLPPYLSSKRMALQDGTKMRSKLRQDFGLGEQDNVLLMIGSGFKRKGLDRAIEGLASLPAELRSKTHLVMVGDGNPKAFNRLAADSGIAANVHISQGRADVPELMQGADVLVHPARHEMAGNVILEAMASGLPVLVNAICGYAYHVAEAGAGRLVGDPFQQSDFNQGLAELLSSGKLDEMRENGIQYTRNMMIDNDGSAEAQLLIGFAQRKQGSQGA